MIEKNEQFNKDEMYDYRLNYLYEIRRIKKAITDLENGNKVESQGSLSQLNEMLSVLTRTVDLMVLYFNDKLSHYAISCKNNLDHCYDEEKYLEYIGELQKLNEYHKIIRMCLSSTPIERQRFLDEYDKLKQEDSKKEKAL